MKTAACIFDVDGTLAETEARPIGRPSMRHSSAAGLDWHWDAPLCGELLKVTGGKERTRAFLERRIPRSCSWSDESIVGLRIAKKTKAYGDIIVGGGVPLRPGVRELHPVRQAPRDQNRRGDDDEPAECRCALRRVPGGEPAGAVFDVIAAGDEAPRKKPAPDIYWPIALDRLGLEPRDCIAFEDSRNGLLSAKSAGLRVVVTPSQYLSTGEDFPTEADLCLPDLTGSRRCPFHESAPAEGLENP